MFVEYLNQYDDAQYSMFNVEGTTLTIEGRQFNLELMQQDYEVITDIVENNNYVARIIIPPAEYVEKVIREPQFDENGHLIAEGETRKDKQPLVVDKVKLILWPKRR